MKKNEIEKSYKNEDIFNDARLTFRFSFYRFVFLHRSYGVGMVFTARSYVRSSVRLYVRTSFTKCTIMYREQTAGRRSANFYAHMHADKIPSSVNFYLNRHRP